MWCNLNVLDFNHFTPMILYWHDSPLCVCSIYSYISQGISYRCSVVSIQGNIWGLNSTVGFHSKGVEINWNSCTHDSKLVNHSSGRWNDLKVYTYSLFQSKAFAQNDYIETIIQLYLHDPCAVWVECSVLTASYHQRSSPFLFWRDSISWGEFVSLETNCMNWLITM